MNSKYFSRSSPAWCGRRTSRSCSRSGSWSSFSEQITHNQKRGPTLDLTVWMYSKWPPPCWKVMGLWLKNHWKVTSSDVSCVALQLSTTLSPTVTSTLWGLSSTRMASVSTRLLHRHPRHSRALCGDAQFDCKPLGRARTKPRTETKRTFNSITLKLRWVVGGVVHVWDLYACCYACVLV